MESRTFNLQQSVKDYIQSIKQQGGLTGSDERELEGHLADSMTSLAEKGLSAEEAFLIASRRLGRTDELSREYSKVSPVFPAGKIWVYMLLGFSLLISLQWLYCTGYHQLNRWLGASDSFGWARMIYIIVNVLVCVLVWSVLKWGHSFSTWLQRSTERRPWLTILVALTPIWIFIFFRGPLPTYKDILPRFLAGDGPVACSYYLSVISMVAVLILSIMGITGIRWRNLMAQAPAIYLVLFGVFVEVVAAMTRVLNNVPLAVVMFCVLYMGGSFCVAYYNERKRGVSLGMFALFGLLGETMAGLAADRARGNTHYTLYFLAAIFVGIGLGYCLAKFLQPGSRPGVFGPQAIRASPGSRVSESA